MALIIPACQPGWEEIENLRGNLRNLKIYEEIWEEIIQNEVSLGGSPTIKVTLNISNSVYCVFMCKPHCGWIKVLGNQVGHRLRRGRWYLGYFSLFEGKKPRWVWSGHSSQQQWQEAQERALAEKNMTMKEGGGGNFVSWQIMMTIKADDKRRGGEWGYLVSWQINSRANCWPWPSTSRGHLWKLLTLRWGKKSKLW